MGDVCSMDGLKAPQHLLEQASDSLVTLPAMLVAEAHCRRIASSQPIALPEMHRAVQHVCVAMACTCGDDDCY